MGQRTKSRRGIILKITVQVDGMMCGMCESHINDAIRKAFPVKKVTSSHSRGETVLLTESDIRLLVRFMFQAARKYPEECRQTRLDIDEKLSRSIMEWERG